MTTFSSWNDDERRFMATALREAERGRGRVEPNPMVGAVIVKPDGTILSTGFHQAFGADHAEVDALKKAGRRAEGCTMYVTLEPCSHHGKTPPCTDAILRSGIKRVVVAMKDPNPLVCGKGIDKLRAAGIQVDTGLMEREALRLNAPYVKLTTTGMPFVTAKWAMSLDGRVATSSGNSRWISSARSRKAVHRLRGRMDAVCVGIGTVLKDDPLLTSRGHGPRNPARLIIDSKLRLPLESQLVRTIDTAPLIVATTEAAYDSPKRRALEDVGAEVIPTSSKDGKVALSEVLRRMGEKKQMTNILVEGGPTLLGAMFDDRLVDAVMVFTAPAVLGQDDARSPVEGKGAEGIGSMFRITDTEVRIIGGDCLLTGMVDYGTHDRGKG